MASGKRDSWRPAFSWSLTSSSLTKWKVERLTALLLGCWRYLLFCFFGGRGGCHVAFAKGPKNSGEEGASCYQLLSLVRAATPLAGKQGVYWAVPLNGHSLFALTQQCQGFKKKSPSCQLPTGEAQKAFWILDKALYACPEPSSLWL